MAKKNVLPIAFVHRADFDGMCSAALLQKYFNNAVEIVPVNYVDKELRSDTTFLNAYDVKNREVYVCDFSFKPNLFKKIIDLSKQTIWLDHHASAVEDIVSSSWYKKGLKALMRGEEAKDFCKLTGFWIASEELPYSGAYLTWAWLFNDKDSGFVAHETIDENGNVVRTYEVVPVPGNAGIGVIPTPTSQAWLDCPQFVKNIAAYDTFRFEFVNPDEAKVQQYGMKAIGLSFTTSDLWKSLLVDLEKDECASYEDMAKKQELEKRIEVLGSAVLQYDALYQLPRVAAAAYPVKMKVNGKNYRGLALNVNGYNSEAFMPAYDPAKHDFFIEYYYNKDHWSYSVYIPEDKKDKVLAVDIVRSFDPEKGGGHRSAAGGNSEKLIKELQ